MNVVDLFCGAGGMTTGILRAAARRRLKLAVTAVNHWDTAVNSHSLNYPQVRHILEPVENLIPAKVVPSRRLHLLAAGIECTFHSNARGGGPCNEQSRSQAWQITRWATDIHVENILIENVREFQKWGPLHPCSCRPRLQAQRTAWETQHPGEPLPKALQHGAKCFRPIPELAGQFFQAFVKSLRDLGRSVEWRVQCAADYGDPTSRERLLLISRANDQPITWPAPTHCDPALRVPRSPFRRLKPWRAARDIIDWSLPGQSIFNRKKPLCANTLARIEAGLRKFGGPNAEPFLIILRGTSPGHLNNAQSLDAPLSTISTTGKHHYLVQPFVLGQQSCAVARDVAEPLPTVATKGAIRLVQPFLTPNFSERPGQTPRTHSTDRPLPAVTGHGAGMLVEPFIYAANHGVEKNAKACPHGRRTKSLDEPLPTITTKRGLGLCSPVIVQTDHTNSNGACTQPLSQPLGTIVSKQNRLLVQPVIAKFYGTGVCQSVTEPLDTVTTRDRFMLVEFRAGRKRGRVLGELDILTRMLQPHELLAAHSFNRDYQLTGTKEDQTTQIGNSVPVELSAAHAAVLLKG